MDKPTLDSLYKDVDHWSRKLEETSMRMGKLQEYMHHNLKFENEYIVNNLITDFRAYSACLAQTLAQINDLKKRKKNIFQRLFHK